MMLMQWQGYRTPSSLKPVLYLFRNEIAVSVNENYNMDVMNNHLFVLFVCFNKYDFDKEEMLI